jgi:hypothetical protein
MRLRTYCVDKEMFLFLVPLTLFLALMVSATATRAYAANNESTPHYLAHHVMLSIAVPLLVDVALQLYGLLSKRIIPSGWIDATCLFLRLMNIVSFVLFTVAAGSFVSCRFRPRSSTVFPPPLLPFRCRLTSSCSLLSSVQLSTLGRVARPIAHRRA